jgi:SulP family sulfate permease
MINFSFKNIKGDIFGGITAGIVALPLALAFGIQAFGVIAITDVPNIGAIGAIAGLTGAMMLGIFAAIFGGTPSQISGPTGPMTVISATLISTIWAANQPPNMETVLLSMSIAAAVCGIFQILFGILKIGKYIRYIPYPVLSGFMSGIGIIIIVQQIYPLIGLKSPVLIIDMLLQFPEQISNFYPISLCMGVGTVIIIYLFPLITKKIPATLVALIIMTLIAAITDYPKEFTIGDIPSGLPLPLFSKVNLTDIDWVSILKMAIIPGLTLAGLGSIDTLLTSVVADNITKTKHNSNKELVGQGIGNMLTGIFAGLPGAGATMRTVVNVKSGGSSCLSGIIHGLFLLAVLLGLGALVSYVPLAVLAGILLTVGIGIIDFRGFKDLLKIPRADATVLITVVILTVFVDLLIAVGIGMIIACVLFMKRAGDLVESGYHGGTVTQFDKELPWNDEDILSDKIRNHIYIQRLNGPIFFGSITRFQEVMRDVPANVRIVIIRMRLVSFMDQSGLYAMENAIKDLQAKNITVLMTIIQPQPLYMLTKMKVIPSVVSEEHVFKSFEDCATFLKQVVL